MKPSNSPEKGPPNHPWNSIVLLIWGFKLFLQGGSVYSPRTTSLTVIRAMDSRDNAEERFFQQLEAEVRI